MNTQTSRTLDEMMTELVNKHGLASVQEFVKKAQEKADRENQLYEEILDPELAKFTAFPIKYNHIWEQYKKQVASFWKAEEINFSGDYNDFLTMNKDEQYFIEMILAFFAASDGIVTFNLSERFTKEVTNTEILFTYQFQTIMENIHSETYSLMLENIVRDPQRKAFLFNAIQNVDSVKQMADWAFKWIDSSESFAHRVVAFAIVEGVFFSGAFASIYWIKHYKNQNKGNSKGKQFMEGLVQSNKLIARDEGMHCLFATQIYDLLRNKLSQEEINKIIVEAVGIACNFMTDALPVKLIGMNNDHMCDYIKYTADRLLSMLGYKKIYDTKNPFKFMETIGLSDKSNFFETVATEYTDPNIFNKSKGKKDIGDVINSEEDF